MERPTHTHTHVRQAINHQYRYILSSLSSLSQVHSIPEMKIIIPIITRYARNRDNWINDLVFATQSSLIAKIISLIAKLLFTIVARSSRDQLHINLFDSKIIAIFFLSRLD